MVVRVLRVKHRLRTVEPSLSDCESGALNKVDIWHGTRGEELYDFRDWLWRLLAECLVVPEGVAYEGLTNDWDWPLHEFGGGSVVRRNEMGALLRWKC